jgi:hypothetical protein
MSRGRRSAVIFVELHRDDATRDPSVGGQPLNAGHDTGDPKLVERIRHRTGVETA